MANSILDSHMPTSSNTILTSHGWPNNTSGNALLVSHGDPYVEGGGGGGGGLTLTHGSSFVLEGTGFGTRAGTPLVYDNFETGTAGNNLVGQAPTYTSKNSGSWTWLQESSGVHFPKYSSANQRANSTRNLLCRYGGAGSSWTCAAMVDHPLTNTGDELFISFWWRYQDTSLVEGGTQYYSRNTKPFDYYDGGYSNPFIYAGIGHPNTDNYLRWNATGIDTPVAQYNPINLPAVNGEWIRFEFYIKQSAPSTANGAVGMNVHRSDSPAIVLAAMEDAATAIRTSAGYQELLWLGAYSSNEDDTNTAGRAFSDIHLDNVYVDTTRQRLELGNASTWAACTRREVQPTTAWSDGSITALCQKGAISSGTAWLFVVGADGTASAGIEVEVT
jgi:hypothetical protein